MKHIALSFAALALAPLAAAAEASLLNAPYITGTHYTARELVPTYLRDVGQPVTEERLEAISKRVEELYRRDGFLVPLIVAQSATGPTPHLHVFEAQVAEVRIQGDAGSYRGRVEAVASALRAQPLLHKAQTQRALRELEDLPGLTVSTSFVPIDGARYAFSLVLNVSFERTEGAVAFTNLVSDEIGRGLLSGRVAFNNLLGTGEELSAIAASSTSFSRYRYVSGSAARTFGLVRVDLTGSHARANIAPDSRYAANQYALEASVPLLRRNGFMLRPLLGIAARTARDEDGAGDAWNWTRSRSVLSGVEITDRRDRHATRILATAERAIDIGNAGTYQRSGDAPDYLFTKTVIEATHSLVLTPGWQLRASAEAQWSDDNLPAGERFVYGGAQYGRAFDAGDLSADSGAALSLQVDRYRQWSNSWLDSGRAFLQVDYAVARDNQNRSSKLKGASLGAGVSARSHGLATTLEVGYALDEISESETGRKPVRVFFSTQYAF